MSWNFQWKTNVFIAINYETYAKIHKKYLIKNVQAKLNFSEGQKKYAYIDAICSQVFTNCNLY